MVWSADVAVPYSEKMFLVIASFFGWIRVALVSGFVLVEQFLLLWNAFLVLLCGLGIMVSRWATAGSLWLWIISPSICLVFGDRVGMLLGFWSGIVLWGVHQGSLGLGKLGFLSTSIFLLLGLLVSWLSRDWFWVWS